MSQPFIPDREELAWAAGFFDGEGCFSYTESGRYAVVSIGQIHSEPLDRFAEAVGFGKIYGPYFKVYPGRLSKKPWFNYRVHRHEQVQAVAAMLWFKLGSIKQEQAIRVLARAAVCRRGHRRMNNQRGCPRCVADAWEAKRTEKRSLQTSLSEL